MKPRHLLFLLSALTSTALAQTSDQSLELSHIPETGEFELSWSTRNPDRTFFIQFSPDLTSGWHYLPLIERGPAAYGLWLSGDRGFFKLRFTDQLSASNDPFTADLSGDGIAAGWALEAGLDPFIDYTGLGPSGSALTWIELYQFSFDGGSDPASANVAGLIVYTP